MNPHESSRVTKGIKVTCLLKKKGIHGDSCRIHEKFIGNSKDSWTKKFPLDKLGCLMSNFAAECFNKAHKRIDLDLLSQFICKKPS